MSLYVSRKRRTDINVIPLIDVMTVLLVFLLVTTRFDEADSLAITPPSAESAGKSADAGGDPVVLAVDKAGRFYLNSVPVERGALDAELARLSKSRKSVELMVVADEATATKDTVYALDRARLAGLTSRLVTRSVAP